MLRPMIGSVAETFTVGLGEFTLRLCEEVDAVEPDITATDTVEFGAVVISGVIVNCGLDELLIACELLEEAVMVNMVVVVVGAGVVVLPGHVAYSVQPKL